jgi:predicted RNA-binding Zn ribbon-like protein
MPVTRSPPYTITPVTDNLGNSGGEGRPQPTLRSLPPRTEPQPGDRPPAPGDLWLVQAFANSCWELERHEQDQFETSDGLAEWLVNRDLLATGTRLREAEHRRALEVRDGIRALLFANNGIPPNAGAVERLNRALRGPGPFVQLNAQARPDFVPWRRDFDGALALIAMIVAVAQLDGRWGRLKACRGDHCGWVFYDHSRNQAGSWCSMSVCGSRTKAREYRRRRRRSQGSSD